MLISHKYRFIFIHIVKNAGTSINAALLPYTFYNSAHRLCYKAAQRFGLNLPQPLNPRPTVEHAFAERVAAQIGMEQFKSYFSFALVRNPWDWQVSLFNYMRKKTEHPQHQLGLQFRDFDEYIHWRCAEEVRFQKTYICDQDDNLLVDFVGRYENLEQDFKTICGRIGIQAELPMLNVHKTKPYQEYYTAETIELVRKTFAPDIEMFGY
jgi:hypothetical protein